ncbi:MAG: hypothetical protein GOV01_01610 [Candidatus Altiarchaeota archaeon]|nr:hypothetical protein [Candidatus Altiarchaeota archaeon]
MTVIIVVTPLYSCKITLFYPKTLCYVKQINEGESVLSVPDVSMPEDGVVFYNPAQALSRDMSILFYLATGVDVLDGMSASGARAIRLAKYGVPVVANDYSSEAIKLIEKNMAKNQVEFELMNTDLRRLLHSRRFGAVDIDPFGSPAPFVHCALQSAVKYIGLAATDTAALAGTYPRVSRRRYGFVSKKLPNHPEIGVRALASFVIREGAKLEIAARPVFAHIFQHYYRVYFEVKKGARRTDKLLDELGTYEGVGPIYMGNLWDKSIVSKMIKHMKKVELGHKLTEKHLLYISDELKFPQPYMDLHFLCKQLKRLCPTMDSLFGKIKGSRTHFSPTGFRTKLSKDEVLDILKTN